VPATGTARARRFAAWRWRCASIMASMSTGGAVTAPARVGGRAGTRGVARGRRAPRAPTSGALRHGLGLGRPDHLDRPRRLDDHHAIGPAAAGIGGGLRIGIEKMITCTNTDANAKASMVHADNDIHARSPICRAG
jgi:hypothetical protein